MWPMEKNHKWYIVVNRGKHQYMMYSYILEQSITASMTTTSISYNKIILSINIWSNQSNISLIMILRSTNLFSEKFPQKKLNICSFLKKKQLYIDTFRPLFSPKSNSSEKLISACCRANFALLNWWCHFSFIPLFPYNFSHTSTAYAFYSE